MDGMSAEFGIACGKGDQTRIYVPGSLQHGLPVDFRVCIGIKKPAWRKVPEEWFWWESLPLPGPWPGEWSVLRRE